MEKQQITKKYLPETHSELAKQWHPTKNGNLISSTFTAGSSKKVWWKCPEGDDHVWKASIYNRTKGSNCPVCSGNLVTLSNCLATTHQKLAEEWHLTKNGNLTSKDVTKGYDKKIWWQCSKREDHYWEAPIHNRIKGSGCPCCSGHKVAIKDSLAYKYPKLAKQWHPTKNSFFAEEVKPNKGGKKAWWICPTDSTHIYEVLVRTRVANFDENINSCPICNSFAKKHSVLAQEWHPQKNGTKKPSDFSANSHDKVWWLCKKNPNHEWEAKIDNRAKGRKCPLCCNKKINDQNSLATLHPSLALEWHNEKNEDLSPHQIGAGSGKSVWWQCQKNKQHSWKAVIESRTKRDTGCNQCNAGWTIENIRKFVKDLLSNLHTLSPADLYILLQQHKGLLETTGKGRAFIQALKSGKFPKEELEAFSNNQPSVIDEYIIVSDDSNVSESDDVPSETLELSKINMSEELPVIETQDILTSYDNEFMKNFMANADAEAVDYFIKSVTAKIWQHFFIDEKQAWSQLEQFQGEGLFAKEIQSQFRQEYQGAQSLEIPAGYCNTYTPNLMQRYVAYLVQTRKRIGNWSGTGAGKTLSAIIASRVIDARVTIICCPNNVIGEWEEKIDEAYPDNTSIYSKEIPTSLNPNKKHHYLIFHYEFFQQPDTTSKLNELLNQHIVDFIVLDEFHYSKQRVHEKESVRKRQILAFLSSLSAINHNLHVLAMSATPVVNDLFEGKTLIEMMTGMSHEELETRPTVLNCIALYKKFITYGVRFVPNYSQRLNEHIVKIDCTDFLDEIRKHKTTVELEAILIKAKLPQLLENLRPKTIVYSHYRDGIDQVLYDAITSAGWKVGFFNGENKKGLDAFKHGSVDVLIATSCIGTGIDGLQKICNRLIIACLPWTHAEYKQLVGRIYRQGQVQEKIDIIILLTYAEVKDERWSWCTSRWNRIKFKKTIADAAVDGVIPEEQLRTQAQAHKDAMAWLERLERGEINEVERQQISTPLLDNTTTKIQRRKSDFGELNQKMNRRMSKETHERFTNNPRDWHDYHGLYREARENWEVIPYKEAIKWCKKRPHIIIGDFGCGEALLAEALENQVHSFDHVAVNEKVIACDMKQVPLPNVALDVAIFSLSLMGSNFVDYLKEANRCLKLDGLLWIAEPTSRIQDIDLFKELLERLGFDVISAEPKWKFTFIKAIKTERAMNEIALEDLIKKAILS